jgi:hypothetical protein
LSRRAALRVAERAADPILVRRRLIALTAAVIAAAAAAPSPASARPLPGAPECSIFPRSSHWNQRVDRLPVAPRSGTIVRSIGTGSPLHANFSAGLFEGATAGIPFRVVGRSQPPAAIGFDYPGDADGGDYPIPANAPIEGGDRGRYDRVVIVLQRGTCRLFELWNARRLDGGSRWRAGVGAIFDLRSNRMRPEGRTSADSTGLPILPGLVRYDEVRRGRIDHALRVQVPRTRDTWVYPARASTTGVANPDLPPAGTRLRLRADFSTAGYPRQARVILTALKRYGMLVAGDGGAWHVSGAPSERWANDQLGALHRVKGSDFEVVDTSSLPRPDEPASP